MRNAAWIEMERKNLQAYEYLCHVGEAKEWIEACLKEEIDPIETLEESLRNGVVIAKLARIFEPTCVKRIFEAPRLQFRHSDNINYFFDAIHKIGLPENFLFELTDLYERKNIPKVIYCIHALGHFLFKKGRAPNVNNLVGKLNFTDEQLKNTQDELDRSGVAMPAFSSLKKTLAKELNEPEPEPELTTEELERIYWSENEEHVIKCQAVARAYLASKAFAQQQRIHKQSTDTLTRIQAQMRGVLARKSLSSKLQRLQTAKSHIIMLQSLSRGLLARQLVQQLISRHRMNEKTIVKLQALARGYLARYHRQNNEILLKKNNSSIAEIQALARGYLARHHRRNRETLLQKNDGHITKLQALARGHLARYHHHNNEILLKKNNGNITEIQALARGYLARHHRRNKEILLQKNDGHITKIQALARGYLARQQYRNNEALLEQSSSIVKQIQALARGYLARQHRHNNEAHLKQNGDVIKEIQALARGYLTRMQFNSMLDHYKQHEKEIAKVQAIAKGRITRSKVKKTIDHYHENQSDIIRVQSVVRGNHARRLYQEKLAHFASNTNNVVKIQSLVRGCFARRNFQQKLAHYRHNQDKIARIQATIRGHMVRKARFNMENHYQQNLDKVTKVQAIARGNKVRKAQQEMKKYYEDNESRVIKAQAITRGILARQANRKMQKHYRNNETQVVKTQALIRGLLNRKKFKATMDHYGKNMDKVVKAQAIVRGIQAREQLKRTLGHYHRGTDDIIRVQAIARGVLARKKVNDFLGELRHNAPAIVGVQALARGLLARRRIDDVHRQLHQIIPAIIEVQGLARGVLARKEMNAFLGKLQSNLPAITQIQALARGVLTRNKLGSILEHCLMFEDEVIQIQAMARGLLARQKIRGTLTHYYGNEDQVIRSQSIARGFLARKRFEEIREYLKSREPTIHKLQGMARGVLTRKVVGGMLEHYATHEEDIIKVQKCVRGFIKRNEERKRWAHYVENTDKVIKVQSIFRAKLANNAYRTLTMVEDPPVSTMRNFIHLLDDGDQDFQEEMELERLRQQAVLTIRQNNELETHLNDLDIKIALLVKNRISLDEVIRASKRQYKVIDDFHVAHSSLKSLDKDSRHRLECYQQLFYLLQTHSIYLARLLFIMNQNFMGDRTKKFVETVVLTLFGFAQNEREEYLLLKLFKAAIDVEISNVETVSDFLRGNPVFIKLAVHYNRGAKERKYLRELLQPLVKQVIEDPTLDLETDPLAIYRKLIREEESREGKKSNRPYDIPLDKVLEDLETRQVLISHLKQLTTITTNFVNSIHNSLDKMPYGIRYIARELREALMAKLPNEQENTILKVVGNLVYYRYINPAIIAPETFDVIETNINPLQRKNLAEVAKMLNQVCVGKPFSNENVGLKALDSYVKFTSESFAQYSYNVTEVCDPEVYFQIDEFLDLANRQKPVIYINTSEVFSVHAMLEESIDMLAPEEDDPLRAVLQDLGPAPTIKSGFQDRELSLTLTNKLSDLGEEESEVKQLFVETKRLVLYVIRIQSGRTLLDILERPVTNRDEQRYQAMIEQERAKGEGIKTNFDISGVDFLTLKKVTFDYLNLLEREGRVSFENGYQEMINSIATDVRNKHRRRIQRRQEMKRIRQTLLNLADKSNYLEEQKNTYLDYIHTCMSQLSQKKNKRSRVLPFTRQYFHLKDLQKSGKMPRFGSYKYTAERLSQKGVLLSMEQFSPKQFDKITMTISSDEAGVFLIEAYLMGAKIADMILRLEDLLQLQFDNVNVTTLFDGAVKVNVNLLLFLINKKFYV